MNEVMSAASPVIRTPSASPRLEPGFAAGWWALLFGALATAIASTGSWIPSIWGDEATSIISAQRPLPSLFRMLGHVDAVHGTYYLLLHFWIDAFGASPFSVRFPSAIAVGLAAAGVVVLAGRLAGRRTALFAGAIFVVLPRTTYMGEEARGYALSAACAVWVTVLLVVLLHTRGRRRMLLWGLYAVGVAACGYIFLFSLLLLIPHAVLVLRHRHRRTTAQWSISVGLALIIAAPVIVFGILEKNQIAFLANRNDASFDNVVVGQWFGNPALAAMGWTFILIAVATMAWRIITGRGPLSTLVVLSAVWALGPTAALWAANAVDPVYSARYLSFTAPAVALLLGSFAAAVRPKWLGFSLVVVLIGTASISYVDQRTPYSKNDSDWAVMSQTVAAHAAPGDAVLFDERARPSRRPRLAMAVYPNEFRGLIDVALDRRAADNNGWMDTTVPLAQVESRLSGVTDVWLIEYRKPGGAADTYGLAKLESWGYVVVKSISGHSSEVLHLVHR